MWLIGIPVGVFVGVLSGVIFLLILRTGFEGTGLKHATALIGELTALASFSLGGSWLAKGVLKDVGQADFLSPYILAFAVTFFVIIAKSLVRAVITIGNQIGQQKEAKQ
jgi:hypothetical protein